MGNFKIVFLATLIFFFSCSNHQDDKGNYQVSNWKQEQITTLLFDFQKRGMKNVTDTLFDFLRSKDNIIFNEYMLSQKYDSVYLFPGNMPNYFVAKKTNIKIPVGYTPEDNSLVLFNRNGTFVAFAYASDDILLLDIIPNKQIVFSIKDSNLVVNRKSFINEKEQFVFSIVPADRNIQN